MLGKIVMMLVGILVVIMLSSCGASSAGDGGQDVDFGASPAATPSPSPPPSPAPRPTASPTQTGEDTPRPPNGTLSTGDAVQTGKLGTYCWSDPGGQGICADKIGIPVPEEALDVEPGHQLTFGVDDIDALANVTVQGYAFAGIERVDDGLWLLYPLESEIELPTDLSGGEVVIMADLPIGEYAVSASVAFPEEGTTSGADHQVNASRGGALYGFHLRVVPTNPPATASPVTSPPPASTSEISPLDYAWGSIGTIKSIEPGNAIHIVEHPEDPTAGEQYIVSIMPETQIYQRTADGTEPQTFSDLQIGMRVVVAFDGAIADSYPGQGGASAVIIIRTETEGPSDPEDTVTMTFSHSLYTGLTPGDPIPSGDAFYLAYTILGGKERQIFFCGETLPAPETCQGYGTTYDVEIEVPRGAELSYAVYRLPGGKSEQQELVEQGREVVDMALYLRSHYRYGAQKPGGYD